MLACKWKTKKLTEVKLLGQMQNTLESHLLCACTDISIKPFPSPVAVPSSVWETPPIDGSSSILVPSPVDVPSSVWETPPIDGSSSILVPSSVDEPSSVWETPPIDGSSSILVPSPVDEPSSVWEASSVNNSSSITDAFSLSPDVAPLVTRSCI